MKLVLLLIIFACNGFSMGSRTAIIAAKNFPVALIESKGMVLFTFMVEQVKLTEKTFAIFLKSKYPKII